MKNMVNTRRRGKMFWYDRTSSNTSLKGVMSNVNNETIVETHSNITFMKDQKMSNNTNSNKRNKQGVTINIIIISISNGGNTIMATISNTIIATSSNTIRATRESMRKNTDKDVIKGKRKAYQDMTKCDLSSSCIIRNININVRCISCRSKNNRSRDGNRIRNPQVDAAAPSIQFKQLHQKQH